MPRNQTRLSPVLAGLLVILLLQPAKAEDAAASAVSRLSPASMSTFSADGRLMARIPRDQPSSIRLWDLTTRRLLDEFSTPNVDTFCCIQFSPSSTLIAAATNSGTIVVRDAATADPVANLNTDDLQGPVGQLHFSTNAKTLASTHTNENVVAIWNLEHNQPSRTIRAPIDRLMLCAFTDRADEVVLVFDTEILLHDLSNAAEPKKVTPPAEIRKAVCSPDGRYLAAGTSAGIALWSLPNLVPTEPLDYPPSATPLFSDGGRYLLVLREDSNTRALDVWDTSRGLTEAVFMRSIEDVGSKCFALSSDDSCVAFGAPDGKTIRIVPLNSYEEIVLASDYCLTNDDPLTGLAFSPDGQFLVSSRVSGVVRLWELSARVRAIYDNRHTDEHTPALLAELPTGLVNQFQFSSDGATLAALNPEGAAILLDVPKDRPPVSRPSFSFHYATGGSPADIRQLDFSPNGRFLAVIGDLRRVFLIDLLAGTHRRLEATPFMMRFNQAGTKLFMVDSYASYFYHTNTGDLERIRRFARPVAASYSERLAWGAALEEAHGIWDPNIAAPVAAIKPQNVQNTGLYAISPDRTKFAIVARKDSGDGIGVEVFDIKNSRRITYMPLDIKSFCAVAFTPDSSRLLIASSHAVHDVNYRRRRVTEILGPQRLRTAAAQNAKPEDSPKPSYGGDLFTQGVEATADEIAPIGTGYSATRDITAMDVSTSGLIATAGSTGIVRLSDLDSGKIVLTHQFPGNAVKLLRFSDNAERLAVVQRNRLYVLNVPSVRPPQESPAGQ